jgi:NDP-sugar pyrophosphorylase family protein
VTRPPGAQPPAHPPLGIPALRGSAIRASDPAPRESTPGAGASSAASQESTPGAAASSAASQESTPGTAGGGAPTPAPAITTTASGTAPRQSALGSAAGSGRIPVCGVILAAGEGQRLRPLTASLPKALCPVGNVALLDRALARLSGLGLAGPATVAVNAAYLAEQIVSHVGDRAHLSVEPDGPLGTSGGIGRLKDWIDGRGVLVGNADGYLADPARDPGKDIAALLDGWTGETVRMLTKPVPPGDTGGFSGRRFAGFSLLPWRWVRSLPAEHGNLVRTVWRPAEAEGTLELIPYDGVYIDTGTPADYLAANLHAANGRNLIDPSAVIDSPNAEVHASVIGARARIHGTVTRCVIWPDAEVPTTDSLTNAIRARGGLTVPAPATLSHPQVT